MKSFNFKILVYIGFVISVALLSSCEGNPINLPPGANGNIISVAINADGVWEETPLAVDASATEQEYNLILVKLNSSSPAPEDIHVTLVPALDSLASFNPRTFDVVNPKTGIVTPHPEKYYVSPGGQGTPAFSLVDNGVAVIPKGSYFGYMKIKTASADYFGATPYAFAYRISNVQEPGYVVSANNGYSITHFIPKNPYDGTYSYTGFIGRYDAAGNLLSLGGTIVDDVTIDVSTTGLTTDAFQPVWAPGPDAGNIGGIGTLPIITVNPDNTLTLTPGAGGAPANWGPIDKGAPEDMRNEYDPATKTFYIHWRWGALSASPSGYGRELRLKMVYLEPRK